eukprot:g905.t1
MNNQTTGPRVCKLDVVEDENEKITRIVLANKTGMSVTLSTYGARVLSIYVPDSKNKSDDVTLCYDTHDDLRTKRNFYGATIGRCANRIKKGEFLLDGKTYSLPINNGPNSLHGGNKGFDKITWSIEKLLFDPKGKIGVIFSMISEDGDQGYPGKLQVTAEYSIQAQSNSLDIVLGAKLLEGDATICNLTNHNFYNLQGRMQGIKEHFDHHVELNCKQYLPVDEGLIPTGEIATIAPGTPFDFYSHSSPGKCIGKDLKLVGNGPVKGYDHCLVIDKDKKNTLDTKDYGVLHKAVKVTEPTSGRVMEIYTNQSGVQFYSGNFLKEEKPHAQYHAFCFETAAFNDAINQKDFPMDTILRKGESYSNVTRLLFSVV